MFKNKMKIVLSIDEKKRVVDFVVLLMEIKKQQPRESKAKVKRSQKRQSSREASSGKSKLKSDDLGPFTMGSFYFHKIVN